MTASATLALAQGPLKLVERPRLTKLLDEATSRILMLIAPAGYGKTTLTRQWMASRPHAWYRGTPAAADVAALAKGLSEVVQPFVKGAGERMMHRLRATGTPEQDVVPLAELLAEDLADWPQDAWLVIDDYQFAAESAASERFVDLLVGLSPIQLFLASRNRPSWATARKLLYGEIYELGRSHLAMNQEEARLVLAHLQGSQASGIVALADGWPAVIGLAALTQRLDLPEDSLPDTLHEYFAEELYRTADAEIQSSLCQLAIIPTITAEIAELALGTRAEVTLAEGVRLGFLTPQQQGTFDLHPLLRAFLTTKLQEERQPVSDELVSRLVRYLIERQAWDDAFAIVERYRVEALFIQLLRAGLPSILAEARLSTVGRWIEFAEANDLDEPIVDLAEAEVAFREGEMRKCEQLGLHAARRFKSGDPLASHAYATAGRAAYLGDRLEIALAYQERALALARNGRDRREALRGHVMTAAKLELEEAKETLEAFIDFDDGGPDSTIAIAAAKIVLGARMLGLKDLLETYRAARHMLPKVRDPILRTSFLTTSGHLLCSQAHYEDALALAERTVEEASNSRLMFALPYAKLVASTAHAGLRNFTRAVGLLTEVREIGYRLADQYLVAEAETRMARVLLSQGLPDAALWEGLDEELPITKGERGEHLVTQALANACLGNEEVAMELCRKAEEITRSAQVRVLAPAVRAIVSMKANAPSAQRLAENAFLVVLDTEEIDAFICAYRAYPPLAASVCKRREWRGKLAHILGLGRDRDLARRLKLPQARRTQRALDLLTPREQEVLELVASGLANKAIAKTLFITEATVKVHVRHICEKLGVRTRTEAAVRAASYRPSGDFCDGVGL